MRYLKYPSRQGKFVLSFFSSQGEIPVFGDVVFITIPPNTETDVQILQGRHGEVMLGPLGSNPILGPFSGLTVQIFDNGRKLVEEKLFPFSSIMNPNPISHPDVLSLPDLRIQRQIGGNSFTFVGGVPTEEQISSFATEIITYVSTYPYES